MSSGPTKTAVEGAARELVGKDSLAALVEASSVGLPIRAAAIALARLREGIRTPSSAVAPLLRWVDPATLGPLIACAEPLERAARVLARIADDELVGGAACSALLLLAIVEGDATDDERKTLMAWLRTYARTKHPLEDGQVLAAAASVLRKREGAEAIAFAEAFDEIADPRWTADKAALTRIVGAHAKSLEPAALDALPADDTETVGEAFTVRRVADKIGRNDACPCGSGKKYKKCCADKDAEREKAPSLRAGFTRDELLRDGAAALLPADVAALPQHDLPRILLERLTTQTLGALHERAIELAAWDLVVTTTRALVGREDLKDPDRVRTVSRSVSALLGRGRARDAATLVSGAIGEDACVPGDALALCIADAPAEPDRLDQAEAFARASLREDASYSDVELPFALRWSHPALAILLARGGLDPQRAEDSRAMLELIEELRDGLGLRPFDPGTELYDLQVAAQVGFDHEQRARGRAEREALDAREALDGLRRKIDESARRTAEAEQRLAEQELALRATDASTAPDDEERRRLRAKIDELKTLVAEGNDERRTLRAEVERAHKPREGAAHARTERREEAAPKEDEGVNATRPRGVHLPIFGKDVERFLRDAPPRVAHDALVCVAELAAGDELRWSEVKQLARPSVVAYSGRIGIHYRVIFRLEPQRLLVDEIVHRKDLEGAVRRAMGS